jgi:hypothetical protein
VTNVRELLVLVRLFHLFTSLILIWLVISHNKVEQRTQAEYIILEARRSIPVVSGCRYRVLAYADGIELGREEPINFDIFRSRLPSNKKFLGEISQWIILTAFRT